MSPSCRISGIKLELLITLPIFVTIQNAKPARHLILDADFNHGSTSRYVVAQSEFLLCLVGHCGMTGRYELGALIRDFYVELKIGIFTEFSRSAWSDHFILNEILSTSFAEVNCSCCGPR